MSEPMNIYWADGKEGSVSENFDFGHFEIQNKKDSWIVLFVASPTAKIKLGWADSLKAAKEKASTSYESINLAFKMGIESVEARYRESPYNAERKNS